MDGGSHGSRKRKPNQADEAPLPALPPLPDGGAKAWAQQIFWERERGRERESESKMERAFMLTSALHVSLSWTC